VATCFSSSTNPFPLLPVFQTPTPSNEQEHVTVSITLGTQDDFLCNIIAGGSEQVLCNKCVFFETTQEKSHNETLSSLGSIRIRPFKITTALSKRNSHSS